VSIHVGAPVRRVEDRPLLTGASRFVDDLVVPGTVHLAILRSPHAHARLLSLQTAAALAAHGVLAVVTAADLAGLAPPPLATRPPAARTPSMPVLARDRVRYVGEPVAAVVATGPELARDALDQLAATYEPLPAVLGPAPDASAVHPDYPDNVCYRWSETVGDVDAAFTRAAHIVRLRIQNNRVAPVALEPRGLLASYDAARDELVVWSAVQMPFLLRADLASVLDLPEPQIRVIAPDVGGGFGGKTPLYPEDVLVPWLALRLRRPVKWIASRTEDLLTTNHGRGLLHEVEAAADAEGHWTGLRVRIVHSVGAYPHSFGLLPPIRSAQFSAGPYRLSAVETTVVAHFSTTSTTGPYRGTGRPEATMMAERVMDALADRLGLDPVEVRRRNLLGPAELPHRAPSGVTYDSGDYPRALDRVLELSAYPKLRAEQAASRARRDRELLGIGVVTSVGMTGTSGWESATVRVERSGRVTVMTGSSPHGQGHRTVWAQVAADALGVRLEDVRVLHGDTAAVPAGVGTFGSRGAPVAAPAVAVAAERVREKAQTLAAHLLECDPRDVQAHAGRLEVAGAPERCVTLADVAGLAYGARPLPAKLEHGLEATARFRPAHEPFAYGAFVAVVRIDRETGQIRLERLVAVDDCGRVLNPLLLHGQMHGALVQGIGQALLERVDYDELGQPLAASMIDYAIPRARTLPWFELDGLVTPTPLTPLGAKGGSEAGCIGAPAAIVCAVLDALKPLGVSDISLPLTPMAVWQALQGARA
jgi:aerobic carbon-monoxide dehydrogenase large subunit